MQNSTSGRFYRIIIKRAIDLLLALAGLSVLSPILLVIIVGLFFSYRSFRIFFLQERIGKDLEPFYIIKFKSMNDKKDSEGKLLPDQERMTPLGSLLRRTSLDELPQLLNVVAGKMSLIGPRPLLRKYIPLYSEFQNRRHEVKPGITGWAQVNGRNAISWKKKFELDVWYVDHLSFVVDLKIIWMTVLKVVQRKDITTEDPSQFQPFNGNN